MTVGLVSASWAQEGISLVRDGKATATVVVPDENNALAKSAANFLVSTLEKSTGVRLPIVEEAKAPAGTKVFIGATKAAQKIGLDVDKLSGLSCVLRVSGGDLYLAGNDQSKNIKDNPVCVTAASRKAVHIFLHDYAGARWLVPNAQELGTEIPKRSSIAAPANLNRSWTPAFDWVAAFNPSEGYEFNSIFLSSAAYKSYGGHSYYDAVPAAKYAKDHPEYFAMLGGVRNSASNHLCIGNPEVQNLIYAEMLRWLDAGFNMVQLAQTDGYRPCECDKCVAIHADPNERVWIVHNMLAQRLAKDRPGKKVVILAYGPTYDPPKTISHFGPNVVIELCHYDYGAFAAWQGKADQFFVYLYNWGEYHALGFAPKSTPRMIAQQTKFFRDQHVRGVYCCGLGESWGLEGPVYYVYNACLDNPDCDWQAELDNYYRAAFGKAYVPMKQFFDSLYARLELNGADSSWTPVLPPYGLPTMPGSPETQYSYFFPPDLLKKMEAKLARAKELEPSGAVNARLHLVERSFLYVQDIANIFHLYHAYQIEPNWQTFEPLARAIKQRDARVKELFVKGGPRALFDGFPPMFAYGSQTSALAGGTLSAALSAPVNWDVDALREKKVLPGVGRKKIVVRRATAPVKLDGLLDEADWAAADTGEFVEIGMGRLDAPTRVKLLYDDKNLYASFECEEPLIEKLKATLKSHGRDSGVYSQDCVEVFIDPLGNADRYYHFICSALPNSTFDGALGLRTDPVDPLFGQEDASWNGEWSYAGRMDVEGKRWTVEIAMPFKTLGVTPATQGTMWKMNLGRERYVQVSVPGAPEELSLWSPNLEQRRFGSFEAMGDVVFQ